MLLWRRDVGQMWTHSSLFCLFHVKWQHLCFICVWWGNSTPGSPFTVDDDLFSASVCLSDVSYGFNTDWAFWSFVSSRRLTAAPPVQGKVWHAEVSGDSAGTWGVRPGAPGEQTWKRSQRGTRDAPAGLDGGSRWKRPEAAAAPASGPVWMQLGLSGFESRRTFLPASARVTGRWKTQPASPPISGDGADPLQREAWGPVGRPGGSKVSTQVHTV